MTSTDPLNAEEIRATTSPPRYAPPTLTVGGDFFTRSACAQYIGAQHRFEIRCTHTAGVRFTGTMVARADWRDRALTLFETIGGNLIVIESRDDIPSRPTATRAYMESSASRLAELVGRDHLLRELFDKAGIEDILEVP